MSALEYQAVGAKNLVGVRLKLHKPPHAARTRAGRETGHPEVAKAAVPEPGPDPHTKQLTHVHGWLMCLAWGFLIPVGVVIACFRTVRSMGTWWFHLHRALQILGFLVSLAGLSLGVYLDPNERGLRWQHKIIEITVNVMALVQVLAGTLIKPPAISVLRRVWNVSQWTLGRSALALGIANIFIGLFLSSIAYKNIIAQAIVLGGLFIIVMLKNDAEYLLVGCTPAEEEECLSAAGVNGSQKNFGQTNLSNVPSSQRFLSTKGSNVSLASTNSSVLPAPNGNGNQIVV